jgi:hypothetical protein
MYLPTNFALGLEVTKVQKIAETFSTKFAPSNNNFSF